MITLTWTCRVVGRSSLNAKPVCRKTCGELTIHGEPLELAKAMLTLATISARDFNPAILDEAGISFVRHEDKPPVPEVEVSL